MAGCAAQRQSTKPKRWQKEVGRMRQQKQPRIETSRITASKAQAQKNLQQHGNQRREHETV